MRTLHAFRGIGILALATALAAGCGARPDEPSAAPTDPAASTAAGLGPSARPSPTASPSTAGRANPSPARTEPAPAPTGAGPVNPSPGGDRRGDLVRGQRNLAGRIDRAGTWVILRTGGGDWALLGPAAAGLAEGATVEVMGSVTAPPAGCPTSQALTVARVS